jgi:hypothetical protein
MQPTGRRIDRYREEYVKEYSVCSLTSIRLQGIHPDDGVRLRDSSPDSCVIEGDTHCNHLFDLTGGMFQPVSTTGVHTCMRTAQGLVFQLYITHISFRYFVK